MGLASDAIFSHHRDTEGHSNLSHITTRLYDLFVMSACGGGKSRIAEMAILSFSQEYSIVVVFEESES